MDLDQANDNIIRLEREGLFVKNKNQQREEKNNLSKTQEVLYQREFKRADNATKMNHKP
jgi:hypothetical protein